MQTKKEIVSKKLVLKIYQCITASNVSEYRVFSGPYFSVFGPEKTPYLDTFHAVYSIFLTKNIMRLTAGIIMERFEDATLIK